MAAFETWSHEVLVRFAREMQDRVRLLDEEVKELTQDRKDLIAVVRRLIKENANDTGEKNQTGSQETTG